MHVILVATALWGGKAQRQNSERRNESNENEIRLLDQTMGNSERKRAVEWNAASEAGAAAAAAKQ